MLPSRRAAHIAWVVAALTVVAACSSTSDSTDSSPPDTETVSSALDDGGDSASTADTVPGTDPATSEPDDSADESVLVIDGPAQVDQDDPAVQDETDEPDSPDGPDCGALARGVTDLTLDAGGGVHDVRVFVPQNLMSEPAPVVLNWHGLGSNGPEQAAFSGYETLAEEEGFIVVHPTGLSDTVDGPNSWQLGQSDAVERDDLAFADALIDLTIADWCGDASRIYSTGMSNGGFFTAVLVCERAERIAAGVSVAGVTHSDSCSPSRAVPYVAFHGTDDEVVPFAGGASTLGDSAFFDQVMPEEFGEFAADAGCELDPVRTEETPEVVRYDYAGCSAGVAMSFYELPGSGHTWPNSPLAEQLAGLGVFTTDIDATVDGWAFMSQFSL